MRSEKCTFGRYHVEYKGYIISGYLYYYICIYQTFNIHILSLYTFRLICMLYNYIKNVSECIIIKCDITI